VCGTGCDSVDRHSSCVVFLEWSLLSPRALAGFLHIKSRAFRNEERVWVQDLELMLIERTHEAPETSSAKTTLLISR